MPTTKQKRKPFGAFASNALDAKKPRGECRNIGKRDSKTPKTSNAASRRFELSTEFCRSGGKKQLDPSPLKLPDPATMGKLAPCIRRQRAVPSSQKRNKDPPRCDDSDDDMDTTSSSRATSPGKESPLETSPYNRRDPSPGCRDREDDRRRLQSETKSAEGSAASVKRAGAKPEPHAAKEFEPSNAAYDGKIAAQMLAPRKKAAATAEEILARARSRPADDVDVVNAMLDKRKKPQDKLIGIFVGEPTLKRSLSIDDSDLSFADGGDDDDEASQISLAVHRSATATRTGNVFRSRGVEQNGVDRGGHRKLLRSNNLGRSSSEYICQQLKSGQTTLSDIQLPSGWKAKMSKSKNRPFYTHPDFGSTWHYPGLTGLPLNRHLSNSRNVKTLLYKDQRIDDPDLAAQIDVQNQTNHQSVNDVEETSSNMCVDGVIEDSVDKNDDSGSDDINLDAFPMLHNANTLFSPAKAGSAERKSEPIESGVESIVETPSTIGTGVGGNLHLRPPRQDEEVSTIAAQSMDECKGLDPTSTGRAKERSSPKSSQSDGKDGVDAKGLKARTSSESDALVEQKESYKMEPNEMPVNQNADNGSLGNTDNDGVLDNASQLNSSEEGAEIDFDDHGGFDQDEFGINSEDKSGDDKTVTTVAKSQEAKSFASTASKRDNGDLNSLVSDHVDVNALLRSGKSKMSNMSPLSTIRESSACKSSEVSPDQSSGQKVEEVQVLKQKKRLSVGSFDTSIDESNRSEHEDLSRIKFEMSPHRGDETKSESPLFEANADTLHDEDDSVGAALPPRGYQYKPKRYFYPPGPLCSLQFLDEIQEGIFDADIWRMSRRRRTTQAEAEAYRRARR